MKWITKRWEEITRDELYAFSKLRINVFVVEQDCPYPEFDDKDQQSIHLWAEEGGEVVAYLRIVAPGVSYPEVAIGRVVVDVSRRGSALGKELMERGLVAIRRFYGEQNIRISAQQYLISFYNNLGFKEEGEGYLEDGIPHIQMLWTP